MSLFGCTQSKITNMKKTAIILIIFLAFAYSSYGQNGQNMEIYFSNPISIDSSSIILIPVRYNAKESTNSSKAHMRRNYLANILFINTSQNTERYLFENNTFIVPIKKTDGYYYYSKIGSRQRGTANICSKKILYLVKNNDKNGNRKIDRYDPNILYVSDINGMNLQCLTSKNENAVDFFVDEDKNTIMVKIQRDYNQDNVFSHDDKDYYYIIFDYRTLKEIKKINIKN